MLSFIFQEDCIRLYHLKRYLRKIYFDYIPFLFYSSLWMIFERGIIVFQNGNFRNLNVIVHEFINVLLSLLYGTTGFIKGYNFGPAWFLISLFSVRIMYVFLERITKKNIIAIVSLATALYVVSVLCSGWNLLPFMLLPSFSGLFYYSIGHCSNELSDRITNKKCLVTILLVICILISVIIFYFSLIKLLLISNIHDHLVLYS